MPGHGEKLTRKQEEALAALLACPTILEAAARIEVDESTLRRWLKQPAFRAAYRQARAQVLEAAVGRLQQAASLAVDTLVKHLAAEKPGDAIRAADLILQHAMRGAELLDLAERVDELEAILTGGSDDDDQSDEEPAGEAECPGPGAATAG
jgi:hypothetical protein